MVYFNTKLHRRIPANLHGVMEYYPDVELFELDQAEYTQLWQKASSAKYLYTNGYEIRPTNWFMYAFQSIKGWLGFSNNCHPQKVSFILNKLAYYGYVKQFKQPDFSSIKYGALSSEICGLVINKRNDETTAQLQKTLITEYFNVEPYLSFNESHQRLYSTHHYGESWIRLNLWELIPQLDPQDDSIIADTLNALDKNQTLIESFLPNSKYAHSAAQYYLGKAKNIQEPSFLLRLFWKDPRPDYLARALVYDPEIARQDTESYVKHYLKQKKYQDAFNLLEILIPNNSKLVLKYLLEIPEIERNELIQKDSPIAAIIAQFHIDNMRYKSARQFYTNIEALSPIAAFNLEIEEHNYMHAYAIFKKHACFQHFSSPKRKELADQFFIDAETAYKHGKPLRDDKQWHEAEHYYLQSLELKKAAYALHPSEENLENVYTHKRLYALLLIDADRDLHKPEESDMKSIHQALLLLRECNSNIKEEQTYHKHALITGLMRQVDMLREKIAMKYSDHSFINDHKLKHQKSISAFIKILKEIISLLEGTRDKPLRFQLGKAHYLLADIQDFFNINSPNINQHYKMAMEAVPDNPFYLLRVSEIFQEGKEKYQQRGISKLKQMGYKAIDYVHWFDERWVKRDRIIYDIKDIHEPPLKSKNSAELTFSFF
ncbi:hypothetical protein [Legionella sainthelensi]|uniref:Uncharacterized protein n=1 Tax=Legionella sainthelensi TaxID=28087 RepID=A0A2H5FMH6_9GAMM|nr:hypothetical protein [Legionella sainthelensi]AUH72755.1 hypothetical protein CAB17_12380 [Legionella sainthelensi]